MDKSLGRRAAESAVAIAALAILLRLVAVEADRRINRVRGGLPHLGPPTGLPYADLHDDALLWSRDFLLRHSRGQADLPRLKDGGVGIQLFSVVTQAPLGINIDRNRSDAFDLVTLLEVAQWRPPWAWWNRRARALDRARQLADFARRSKGALVLVRSREDLAAALAQPTEKRPVAGILSIEGGAPLEGDPANVGVLYDAGYRMISLAHFVDTRLAGSAHGVSHGGLTPVGRKVLQEMARRGMILDLAHASAAQIEDVLREWRGPLMVSHTGVRAVCDNARNLTDDQLRAIARRGGIVGIGFWQTATCGRDAEAVADSILRALEVAGPHAVALGSDFDGAVVEPFDATGLPALASVLAKRGLSAEQVALVMGGNARRFLLESLPSGEAPAPRN